MTVLRSLAPLPFVLATAVALTGCSQSQGRQLAQNSGGDGAYPARLTLDGGALPVDTAPIQPADAIWEAAAPDRIAFGVPGRQPLLTIACTHDAAGAASVQIVRTTRAEDGAKALFAVIGNGRIARLPLDAVRSGEAGRWEASLPAADLRLDVLRGGQSIEATLPGGGTLKLPASREPGQLLTACRASDSARPA